MQLAHDAIRIQIKAQQELREKVGVTGKRDYTKPDKTKKLDKKLLILQKKECMLIARSGSSKTCKK